MVTEQSVIDKYLRLIHPDIVKYASGDRIDAVKASKITENTDVDREAATFLCMLAKIGMRDGFAGFRPDIVPRLRGLYRFAMVRDSLNGRKHEALFKLLSDEGIHFICGYNLSLKLGYSEHDSLLSGSTADIVVHQRQYEKARRISENFDVGLNDRITVCDSRYVWKHTIGKTIGDTEIQVLNPTSLFIVYGEYLWASLLHDEMYGVDALESRMKWLYAYAVIGRYRESVDFHALAKRIRAAHRHEIRFIFEYAYRYFGRSADAVMLEKWFPLRKDHPVFLERMERRALP